jgi:hypothetical protein
MAKKTKQHRPIGLALKVIVMRKLQFRPLIKKKWLQAIKLLQYPLLKVHQDKIADIDSEIAFLQGKSIKSSQDHERLKKIETDKKKAMKSLKKLKRSQKDCQKYREKVKRVIEKKL